eukprot:5149419-Karenia_brevis.AAC.1
MVIWALKHGNALIPHPTSNIGRLVVQLSPIHSLFCDVPWSTQLFDIRRTVWELRRYSPRHNFAHLG